MFWLKCKLASPFIHLFCVILGSYVGAVSWANQSPSCKCRPYISEIYLHQVLCKVGNKKLYSLTKEVHVDGSHDFGHSHIWSCTCTWITNMKPSPDIHKGDDIIDAYQKVYIHVSCSYMLQNLPITKVSLFWLKMAIYCRVLCTMCVGACTDQSNMNNIFDFNASSLPHLFIILCDFGITHVGAVSWANKSPSCKCRPYISARCYAI